MATNILYIGGKDWGAGHLTTIVGTGGGAFANKNCPQGRAFVQLFQIPGVCLGVHPVRMKIELIVYICQHARDYAYTHHPSTIYYHNFYLHSFCIKLHTCFIFRHLAVFVLSNDFCIFILDTIKE